MIEADQSLMICVDAVLLPAILSTREENHIRLGMPPGGEIMHRHALLRTVVVCCASLFAAKARASVIAHYSFDEAGGLTATDSVGGVTGTLQGSATFVPGGIAGNALSLSTTNEGVVNMGNKFAFLSGNYSVAFWVKTTTTEADTVVLSKHAAGFENGYLFSIGPTGGGGLAGKTSFAASEVVPNGLTSTTTVNDGAWHQIVGVYTAGGNHSIYVDGAPAEQSKATVPMIDNVAAFYVGGVGAIGNPTVADGRYTGLVDDLQLYNNALTDAEVNTLFANPGKVVPEPASLSILGLATAATLIRRHRAGQRITQKNAK
jgi:hypothetical protein